MGTLRGLALGSADLALGSAEPKHPREGVNFGHALSLPRQSLGRGRQKSIAPEGLGFQKSTGVL